MELCTDFAFGFQNIVNPACSHVKGSCFWCGWLDIKFVMYDTLVMSRALHGAPSVSHFVVFLVCAIFQLAFVTLNKSCGSCSCSSIMVLEGSTIKQQSNYFTKATQDVTRCHEQASSSRLSSSAQASRLAERLKQARYNGKRSSPRADSVEVQLSSLYNWKMSPVPPPSALGLTHLISKVPLLSTASSKDLRNELNYCKTSAIWNTHWNSCPSWPGRDHFLPMNH